MVTQPNITSMARLTIYIGLSNDIYNVVSPIGRLEDVNEAIRQTLSNDLDSLTSHSSLKNSWAAYGPGNLNRLEIIVID